MSKNEQLCPNAQNGTCALHHHDIDPDELMTKPDCREKHKWNVWAFGVVFALMSLFLALSGIALANTSANNSKLGDIKADVVERVGQSDQNLAVHLARQEEANKALMSTLTAMNQSINANTEMLKKQNEQISAQSIILQQLSEKIAE